MAEEYNKDTNPWFGIDAQDSGQLTTTKQAEDYKATTDLGLSTDQALLNAQQGITPQPLPSSIITTDGVKEEIKATSDKLDTYNGNISQLSPEQRAGLEGYDENGNKLPGYQFDVFGNVTGTPAGKPVDQEAENAAYADLDATGKQIYDLGKQYEADVSSIQSEIDSYSKNLDSYTSAIVQNIKDTFAGRIRQMESINKNVLGAQKLLGARSGRQRYASELQASIISNEERAGISRLADLDAQMNSLILEAEQARDAKQYAILQDKMTLATSLYNEKKQTLMDLHTLAKERDEALAQQAKDSREELKFIQEQSKLYGDTMAASLIMEDEEGNLVAPDPEVIKQISDDYGFDPNIFTGSINAKISELNKLGQEERKREWDILKIQSDLANAGITNDIKEYKFAQSQGFAGSLLDYQAFRTQITAGMPNSYKEWQLAGGLDGTGKTYAQYLDDSGLLGSNLSNETQNAISLALAGLKFGTVSDRKDAQALMNSLLSEGRVDEAKEMLQTFIFNSASATQQDVLTGKKDSITALERIQNGLNEFQEAGGNTGVFTGLSEKGLNKIGQTLSPELATIANDIAVSIIDYRRAVSGAAFTESEKRAYDSVFPSIGNTPELNTAKINQLIDKFQTDEENFYKNRIGSGKFETIFGEESQSTIPAEVRNYQELIKQVPSNYIVELSDFYSDPDLKQAIRQTNSDYPELSNKDLYLIFTGKVLLEEILSSKSGDFNNVGGDTKSAINAPVKGTYQGLPMYDTYSVDKRNRSDRNNNPGNIKVSSYSKTFPGVVGVESRPAQDGGYFLVFKTPQDGANAVGKLLQTGKSYKGINAEQAIKRYNGNGSYGARTVGLDPTKDFQSQIKDPNVLARVVKALMKAEGYTGLA